ncbi:MAG TPA: peptidoglycan-binding protein [Thermoanaerobaculia bacterium]|nr:peptidoglycan-binding protein [Thermoanaerobaculia bacterium]
MSIRHIVQSGDTVESIAFTHGLFWETVWNADENAELRKLREPNILVPGDVVVVPAKRPGVVTVATGKLHRFRRRGVPSVLNVRLLDDGVPRAAVAWTVEAGGRTVTGTTDADGWIHCYLMPDVKAGVLRLDATGESWEFDIGNVAPPGTTEGVQTRLHNLGYYSGAITGRFDEATIEALRRFQRDAELPDTGAADEATVAKLDAYERTPPPP